MDINRNNYESFLLLYVDNELSIAERKAVEAFVGQNPDLQEELQMLQQTVLPATPLTFAHKAALHKLDTAAQEDLLLYLHNELAPAKAKELEQALATDRALQNEWAILQQTQLDATETITFGDKASLYRYEKTRVVGIKWWRMAAAALLLGFGIWGGITLMDKDSATLPDGILSAVDNTTKNNGTITNADSNIAIVKNVAIPEPKVDASIKNEAVNPAPLPFSVKRETAKVRSTRGFEVVDAQNNLERLKKETKTKNLENFNTSNSNETIANNVPLTNSELKPAVITPIERVNADNATNTGEILKGNAAEYAVNKANDVGATNDYLATSNKRARKSGLLRKVTRFFQRSVNNRGEGDGLKIAGFEFAVR